MTGHCAPRLADDNAPGFTLVELLVALFVFSLIAVAGVSLLRSSADGQVALKERLSGHNALMRTIGLIESDLAQAVPRPVRDSSGAAQAAFISGSGALFTVTRDGLSAGAGSGVSAIGRVGYEFTGGALRRISRNAADGGAAAVPAILLENLASVTVRFRRNDGQWVSDWSASPAASSLTEMPRAVEMTITPTGRSAMRVVALVGPHARPVPAAAPPGEGAQ